MASILLTYGTHQGQTATVAERIDAALTDRGHDVTTLPVEAASSADVGDYDAVLVGSPVNYQRHLPAVVAFVERNRDALTTRPTGFFQLSLAAVMPFASARTADRERVDAMAEATGWTPDHVACFAGAVAYTQYDWPTRWLFRLVSMLTTGDTDTTRDYEYTDWAAVERFAVEFAEAIEATGRPDRTLGPRLRRVAALGVVGVALAGAAYVAARRRHRATGPERDEAAVAAVEPASA